MQPVHYASQPYEFGYGIKQKHGEQYRQENGNVAGGVEGSYGFTDIRGVKRQVDYVADHTGFRAAVKTNEPGTNNNQNPAHVQILSIAPYTGEEAVLSGVGLSYGGYGQVREISDSALGYGSISSRSGAEIANELARRGLGNLYYDVLGTYGGPIN